MFTVPISITPIVTSIVIIVTPIIIIIILITIIEMIPIINIILSSSYITTITIRFAVAAVESVASFQLGCSIIFSMDYFTLSKRKCTISMRLYFVIMITFCHQPLSVLLYIIRIILFPYLMFNLCLQLSQ